MNSGRTYRVPRCPRLFLVLALAALLSFACTRRDGTDGATPSPQVNLPEGDYLSTAYIDELKRTHSPRLAGSSDGIQLVQLYRQGGALALSPILNFHEGSATLEIASKNSLRVVPADRDVAGNPQFAWIDDHSFRFGHDRVPVSTYTYVQKAESYVASLSLVGKYVDRNGREYEFGEDGWARFPDRKFQYEIGLDYSFNSSDYFMDTTDNNRAFAFKRSGDRLLVFRTSEDGLDDVPEPKPQLVLRRLN